MKLDRLLLSSGMKKSIAMRAVSAIVFVIIWGLFAANSFAVEAVDAADAVVIDLGTDTGPATCRASGFLHTLTADQPPQELVEPLKPRLFRLSPANIGLGPEPGVYERATAMGAKIQVGVASAHGCSGKHPCPGDDGSWARWDHVVDYLLSQARAKGYEKLEWDIWNEPNLSRYWARDQEQFREMWRRTVRKIRDWDPKAVVVGPSVCNFDSDWLQWFLLWAKDKDVLPNVLCWHEFGDPAAIPGHVDTMRRFLKECDIDITRFSLNEIIGAKNYTQPGTALWYLWAVETCGIESAAHACWPDENKELNGCMTGMLDGLLTPDDHRPRSTWWVYRKYADVTGRLVKVEPTTEAVAIAGWDASQKEVRAVLGRKTAEKGELRVRFANLDRARGLVSSGDVRVVIELIPDSGWAPLGEPVVLSDSIRPIDSGGLTLTIPDMGPTDACFVRLASAVEG